jgi:hypothetical protein
LEERKVYYAIGPSPGYLQNSPGPELRVVEVFNTEKSSSKKAGNAEADLTVSCSRLQYIMSAQLWMKAIHSF